MPGINLRSVTEGISPEQTLENVLDTLQLYRKELNFLLMNLDRDNMPPINNYIIQNDAWKEEADNEFAFIDVSLGQITLAVGDLEGDVASLVIRADSIESTVSSMDGRLSQVIQDADGITSIVTDGDELISIINQTAGLVKISAENIELDGITRVASQLRIGNYGDDEAMLVFGGSGANIKANNYGEAALEIRASDVYITGNLHVTGAIFD